MDEITPKLIKPSPTFPIPNESWPADSNELLIWLKHHFSMSFYLLDDKSVEVPHDDNLH